MYIINNKHIYNFKTQIIKKIYKIKKLYKKIENVIKFKK